MQSRAASLRRAGDGLWAFGYRPSAFGRGKLSVANQGAGGCKSVRAARSWYGARMGEVFDQVRRAVQAERYVFSDHADNMCASAALRTGRSWQDLMKVAC